VWITEEEARDRVFRRVHTCDPEADDAGANLDASLDVPGTGGGMLGKWEVQLLRPKRWVSRHVGCRIDPKVFGQPVACVVFEKQIQIDPATDVAGRPEDLPVDGNGEPAHQ